MVFPSTGMAWTSRYERMMPPAVMASEVARRTMVRLAVRTLGSRMIPTAFDTASIPV